MGVLRRGAEDATASSSELKASKTRILQEATEKSLTNFGIFSAENGKLMAGASIKISFVGNSAFFALVRKPFLGAE